MALLAAGTGNDFAKSVGVPARDYSAMARLAFSGPEIVIDVGRVEDRIFLNSAGFAFDAAVLELTERARWLRGPIVYVAASLRILVGYQGVEASILSSRDPLPDERSGSTRYLAIVIANGRHFGGSFLIAPHARLNDGLLDLVSIAQAGTLRRARIFQATMRGAHLGFAEVGTRQAASVRLRFRAPPLYQIDGELCRAQASELEVRCETNALRVVTSPASTSGSAGSRESAG
jgi:diacylglycerol kinase (ATP)